MAYGIVLIRYQNLRTTTQANEILKKLHRFPLYCIINILNNLDEVQDLEAVDWGFTMQNNPYLQSLS